MGQRWSTSFAGHPSAPDDARAAELDALARARDLGTLVQRLGGSSDYVSTFKLAGPILVVIAIALPLLIAFGDPPKRPARHGRRAVAAAPVDALLHDPRALASPFALVFGVGSLVELALLSGTRLHLYERGLVYRRAGRREVLRWEDVASVRASIVHVIGGSGPGMRGFVALDKRAGGKLEIGARVEALEQVRDVVRKATFPLLYPPVVAALERGEPVGFGPVILRRDGLVKDGRFEPWSAIEQAMIWEGKLEVRKTGSVLAWFKLKTRDIPNVHVLMAAIDEVRHR
ncbi:MAG TPA: DUF6585 family protein [Minicystis sp.]|nr:DUF6585 family protein [Minicystis sp.]